MSEVSRAVSGRSTVTLDHLVALNDEIAALVRTGLPLERGLREVGGDLSGRLGGIMKALGERMSRGASLPEALDAEGDRLPRIYRAVVEAGLRAGRLGAALESLTGFVRAYLDSRRSIGLALSYPLIVLSLAYGLFVLILVLVVPRFLSAFEMLRIPIPAGLHGLGWLGTTLVYWGPILPAVLVAGLACWVWSGTSAGFRPGRAWSLLAAFPWIRSMLRHYEAANFADLLGMLLGQGVPYPEALSLASEATGDAAVIRLGRALAAAVERGDAPGVALRDDSALPPLLRWLLATGRQQVALADSLHGLAAIYRKRAEHQAEKIRVFLPMVLLVIIGMSATLLFGLTIFVPFSTLLKDLAIPG
jgi:type II secretory pathway component PulF